MDAMALDGASRELARWKQRFGSQKDSEIFQNVDSDFGAGFGFDMAQGLGSKKKVKKDAPAAGKKKKR